MRNCRSLILAALLVAGLPAGAGESATALIAQADRLWAENRLELAQKSFEAAVKAEPEAALPRFRLAGFQLARQQSMAAIANYQKVIGLEPKNAKAWIGLGMAYLHVGKPEMAHAALDEAVRIEPQRREKLAPLLAKLETRNSSNGVHSN